MTLYADVADTGLAFGTAALDSPTKYVSTADVASCEQCHGAPYLKHGYRAAVVDRPYGLCRVQRVPLRRPGKGGHLDWQWMVDQPLRMGDGPQPAGLRDQVRVQGQRDAGHAPDARDGIRRIRSRWRTASPATQARSTSIRNDTKFTAETCKSCHPVNGKDLPWTRALQKYDAAEACAGMKELWTTAGVSLVPRHRRWRAATATCRVVWPAVQGIPHRLRQADLRRVDEQRYADLAANKVSIDAVTLDRQRAGRQVQRGQRRHRSETDAVVLRL